jgi:anti-anti-sigma factor
MPASAWSDFPVVELHGSLDFAERPRLRAILERAERLFRITFDLEAVAFVDASALSCFVHLHNRMRPNRELPGTSSFECSIRLIGVRPFVARLIRLVGLDDVFEVVDISAVLPNRVRVPLGRCKRMSSESHFRGFAEA